MDFYEFLIKKKIDRSLFSNGEPELFLEFEREYSVMGAKSFDHTKKFWFNKLRRAYHLTLIDIPKVTIEQTEPIAQAATLESPTIVQKPAYTPRFKAPPSNPGESASAASKVDNEKSAAETPDLSIAPPKPVYVPRFKAPVRKSTD